MIEETIKTIVMTASTIYYCPDVRSVYDSGGDCKSLYPLFPGSFKKIPSHYLPDRSRPHGNGQFFLFSVEFSHRSQYYQNDFGSDMG